MAKNQRDFEAEKARWVLQTFLGTAHRRIAFGELESTIFSDVLFRAAVGRSHPHAPEAELTVLCHQH